MTSPASRASVAPSGSPATRIANRTVATQRTHQGAGQAGVGNQADAPESGHEARLLGGHDQVGGKGEAHAGTRGDAVHRGHHRLRKVAQRADQRVVLARQDAAEVALAAPTAQVGASAEGTPGSGEHHAAHRIVAGDALQAGQQLPAERGIERVERIGAVEGQRGDAIGHVDGEVLEGGCVRHRRRL